MSDKEIVLGDTVACEGNPSKAQQPTIQRGGGVVGRGVESMQHLFTPGGEAILRLHALQQLQQLVLLVSPLTSHHVLFTAEMRKKKKTGLGLYLHQ